MRVCLSKDEMIRLRRESAGFDISRTDCTIEETDGIEVDALIERELRTSYLALLDEGDRNYVCIENASDAATCFSSVDANFQCVRVSVPEKCRCVTGLCLKGWLTGCDILSANKLEHVISMQLNPYTAATVRRPVAVFASGDKRTILAWPPGNVRPEVSVLEATVDPGPDFYILDERGVERIVNC